MTSSAVIFPGQGSQSVGMLAELSATEAEVRETFDQASEVLGRDCWALVSQGPEHELNETQWTQPMMLAADIALWRVYLRMGGSRPAFVAGHSLGEYAALVAAEAIDFGAALAVVHLRGQLMQQAVPADVGAMAAVLGLDDVQVEQVCAAISAQLANQPNDQAGGGMVVVPANYNAPGQVVIAGHAEAVALAIEACKAAGARRALQLPVSVPSHSPLMQPAVEPLQAALSQIEISTPRISLLHNFDVKTHADADAIRAALAEQLTHPVRWTETVLSLVEQGVDQFYECGPGRVLSGLGKRIDRSSHWLALDTLQALEAAAA